MPQQKVKCLTCGSEISFEVRTEGPMSIPFCLECKMGICPDCGGRLDLVYVNKSALQIPSEVACSSCSLQRKICII